MAAASDARCAVTMEAVLAAADAKLRLMFNSVEYFVSDDPLFATLVAAVGSTLGAERAAKTAIRGLGLTSTMWHAYQVLLASQRQIRC